MRELPNVEIVQKSESQTDSAEFLEYELRVDGQEVGQATLSLEKGDASVHLEWINIDKNHQGNLYSNAALLQLFKIAAGHSWARTIEAVTDSEQSTRAMLSVPHDNWRRTLILRERRSGGEEVGDDMYDPIGVETDDPGAALECVRNQGSVDFIFERA